MRKGRKISGGKYHRYKKKKLHERQTQERVVTLKDETKRKNIRRRGGNQKTFILSTNIVNLFNSKTKKTQKAKIKNVIETPQNVFLARQNRLVKSAIIETELGRARITNRPSQEGCVNAVLIEES